MSRRTQRVAEAIRRLASEILNGQLRDPRVKSLITVTRVEVMPNLKFAKIYYSVLGDDKKKALVAKGLRSAKGFIRKRIGEELELRYAPNILFELDKKFEHGERVNEILEEIKKEGEDEKNRDNSKDN